MGKKRIWMISGKLGSGKTSLANLLYKNLAASHKQGYPQMYKFADPLYTMHEYLLNFMERSTGIKRVEKDGKLLQWIGTEFGRQGFGDDVWVNILKKRIEDGPHKDIIVDDCRFKNEFDAFPEAIKIRLEAPSSVRVARASGTVRNEAHPSEIDLDSYAAGGKFDYVFDTSKQTTEEISEVLLKQINLKG